MINLMYLALIQSHITVE